MSFSVAKLRAMSIKNQLMVVGLGKSYKSSKNDIFAKTHDWFDEVCHTDLSNREPYGQWGRPFPEDTVEIK